MTRHARRLTPEETAAVKDEDIDFGDIPELDASFWREAKVVEPDRTERITLRVKRSVLEHFRAQGPGYQTRINRVLESYVRTKRGSADRWCRAPTTNGPARRESIFVPPSLRVDPQPPAVGL